METYKLHIKVGPHEFQGEGTEESVKSAFEDWKALIASHAKPDAAPSTQNSAGSVRDQRSLDNGQQEKLFLHDGKKRITTLRVLPRGENRDALLLVLLGFKQVQGQDEVPVTQLKPALKQSGCNVDRVDAVAAKHLRDGLINKGGMGKGGRYSLTNSGVERATSIALGLLS